MIDLKSDWAGVRTGVWYHGLLTLAPNDTSVRLWQTCPSLCTVIGDTPSKCLFSLFFSLCSRRSESQIMLIITHGAVIPLNHKCFYNFLQTMKNSRWWYHSLKSLGDWSQGTTPISMCCGWHTVEANQKVFWSKRWVISFNYNEWTVSWSPEPTACVGCSQNTQDKNH